MADVLRFVKGVDQRDVQHVKSYTERHPEVVVAAGAVNSSSPRLPKLEQDLGRRDLEDKWGSEVQENKRKDEAKVVVEHASLDIAASKAHNLKLVDFDHRKHADILYRHAQKIFDAYMEGTKVLAREAILFDSTDIEDQSIDFSLADLNKSCSNLESIMAILRKEMWLSVDDDPEEVIEARKVATAAKKDQHKLTDAQKEIIADADALYGGLGQEAASSLNPGLRFGQEMLASRLSLAQSNLAKSRAESTSLKNSLEQSEKRLKRYIIKHREMKAAMEHLRTAGEEINFEKITCNLEAELMILHDDETERKSLEMKLNERQRGNGNRFRAWAKTQYAELTARELLLVSMHRQYVSPLRLASSFSTRCIVAMCVEGMDKLWASSPESFVDILEKYKSIVTNAVRLYEGSQLSCTADYIVCSFPHIEKAIQACLNIQTECLATTWPRSVTETPCAEIKFDHEGTLLFNGPRVRMAIHADVEAIVNNNIHGALNLAYELLWKTPGGVIGMTPRAIVAWMAVIEELETTEEDSVVASQSVVSPVTTYYPGCRLVPTELYERYTVVVPNAAEPVGVMDGVWKTEMNIIKGKLQMIEASQPAVKHNDQEVMALRSITHKQALSIQHMRVTLTEKNKELRGKEVALSIAQNRVEDMKKQLQSANALRGIVVDTQSNKSVGVHDLYESLLPVVEDTTVYIHSLVTEFHHLLGEFLSSGIPIHKFGDIPTPLLPQDLNTTGLKYQVSKYVELQKDTREKLDSVWQLLTSSSLNIQNVDFYSSTMDDTLARILNKAAPPEAAKKMTLGDFTEVAKMDPRASLAPSSSNSRLGTPMRDSNSASRILVVKPYEMEDFKALRARRAYEQLEDYGDKAPLKEEVEELSRTLGEVLEGPMRSYFDLLQTIVPSSWLPIKFKVKEILRTCDPDYFENLKKKAIERGDTSAVRLEKSLPDLPTPPSPTTAGKSSLKRKKSVLAKTKSDLAKNGKKKKRRATLTLKDDDDWSPSEDVISGDEKTYSDAFSQTEIESGSTSMFFRKASNTTGEVVPLRSSWAQTNIFSYYEEYAQTDSLVMTAVLCGPDTHEATETTTMETQTVPRAVKNSGMYTERTKLATIGVQTQFDDSEYIPPHRSVRPNIADIEQLQLPPPVLRKSPSAVSVLSSQSERRYFPEASDEYRSQYSHEGMDEMERGVLDVVERFESVLREQITSSHSRNLSAEGPDSRASRSAIGTPTTDSRPDGPDEGEGPSFLPGVSYDQFVGIMANTFGIQKTPVTPRESLAPPPFAPNLEEEMATKEHHLSADLRAALQPLSPEAKMRQRKLQTLSLAESSKYDAIRRSVLTTPELRNFIAAGALQPPHELRPNGSSPISAPTWDGVPRMAPSSLGLGRASAPAAGTFKKAGSVSRHKSEPYTPYVQSNWERIHQKAAPGNATLSRQLFTGAIAQEAFKQQQYIPPTVPLAVRRHML